jgi:hypothetical protein
MLWEVSLLASAILTPAAGVPRAVRKTYNDKNETESPQAYKAKLLCTLGGSFNLNKV